MRRVEVCRGDGQAAMEVQVEETASLQEIMDSVARTCGVSNDFIRISLDGKRARALQDVRQTCWTAITSLIPSAKAPRVLLQLVQEVGICELCFQAPQQLTLHCWPSSAKGPLLASCCCCVAPRYQLSGRW